MKKLLVFILLISCLQATEAQSGMGREHPVFGHAQWISTERSQSVPNTWLIYRKVADIAEKPSSLLAHIAVDSKYWLWINGEMVVFEGGLKRGPTPVDGYYDSVEIAPYLKQGENTIALLVWFFGKDGFSHVSSGKAGLLFAAVNENISICSDRSWNCAVYDAYQNTEAPHPNFRLSESNIRFDARQKLEGWESPGFEWHLPPAMLFGEPDRPPMGRLYPRPIPQWKDYGLKEYESIRRSGDTLYCKLPYNAQITPYLSVESPAGETIFMQTDNYAGGSELNVRAEYITKEGVQEYESYGWMNGHEMAYVIPPTVKVLKLMFRETGYDTEFDGSFTCNDPFYDELWKRSLRTLYITMRDNYMDCPDRERAQWWGDEVNELGETFYALSPSSHKLAVKGIYELMNHQRSDGSIYSPVPAGNWDKELPLQMLASVGWHGFYTQYFYSGDSSFVAPVYNRMRYYLHRTWTLDKSGLVNERAGEWSWGDWGDNVDLGVLTNCWYYLALKAEREFALQLGKSNDAASIGRQMTTLKNVFDTKFWTGTAYRAPGYKGETDDRAQAMAVLSGLASKDKYPAILKVLQTEYHASPYMEKYVLEALFEMDEPAFALERMKQRYTRMLDYDYTTLFEGWGIGAEGFGGGTINHAWSGGPLTMLSQKVCGVAPTSPGFKTFAVKPQLGTLTDASAVIPTHYGNIEVDIKKQRNRLTVDVVVPEGTEATVVLPGKQVRLTAGKHTVSQ